MEVKEFEKYCIITPLSPKMGQRESFRLSSEIKNSLNKRIGINMTFVKDCTIDFINQLACLKNISLFNISSDIFAILTSMNLDKSLALFVSEMDFLDDKHQLINRHFSII